MDTKQKAVLFSALLALVTSAPLHAAAAHAKATVFQIGAFDRSSNEFPGGTPDHPVKFTIGKSDAAKDWYAMQKVAVLPVKSATPAPRTIQFVLDGKPAPTYEMHLAFLIESDAVPAIRVGIDGKQGTFYLHPRLDFRNGDQWNSFYPAYSHADVTFQFPGAYLHKGENVITLQPVSDKQVAGGTLTYDAVALTRETTPFRTAETTRILPTIFYKKVNGQLDELIDVFIRHSGPMATNVELTIGGKAYHQNAQPSAFGESRLRFEVTEFPAETKAEVIWSGHGRRSHYQTTLTPQKKWTLYLVPHIHLDIGYSDYQAKVAAIHSHVVDEAMEMMAAHPDFRFSLDGFWPLQQFMETRTPAQRQHAFTAMRNK
ncbi:MAG: polysaccharide lyase family protein, partial [Acidobacteriaceae bacterium]